MRIIQQHILGINNGTESLIVTTTTDDAGSYTTTTHIDVFNGEEPSIYYTGGAALTTTTNARSDAGRIHNRYRLMALVNHRPYDADTMAEYLDAITA